MDLRLRPSKRGTQRGEEEWDAPAWSVVGKPWMKEERIFQAI